MYTTFIIDDKIPFIKGVFEPFGEVTYLPGDAITPAAVKEAGVMVVRTRTRCDEALLAGSSVSFIATATIGHDHIDVDYCRKAGIQWINAAGCNASSVVQYVAACLSVLFERGKTPLEGKTLGVIGVGHVGSKVAEMARLLGMNVLLNDPPRAKMEGSPQFCTLDDILEKADIITLHVPLTHHGSDPTYRLINESLLHRLKCKPILINTSRGDVIHTQAVTRARVQGLISALVVDCWDNEPFIDPLLMNLADIATPHIAGYSRDGKALGTTMVVQAISRFFGLGIDDWQATVPEQPVNPILTLTAAETNPLSIVTKSILGTYGILLDDSALRHHPTAFEQLRDYYPVRREFFAYTIHAPHLTQDVRFRLESLGFNVSK